MRPLVRLLVPLLLSAGMGWLLLAGPASTAVTLRGESGSMLIPRTLEGWQVQPGSGDVLLSGRTLLPFMSLEVRRVPASTPAQLVRYIAEEHDRQFSALPDYQVRLRGEVRKFGQQMVPVARAVYSGEMWGVPLRMVQHDGFWRWQGEYARLRLCYPELLERYFWGDLNFIASNFKPMP